MGAKWPGNSLIDHSSNFWAILPLFSQWGQNTCFSHFCENFGPKARNLFSARRMFAWMPPIQKITFSKFLEHEPLNSVNALLCDTLGCPRVIRIRVTWHSHYIISTRVSQSVVIACPPSACGINEVQLQYIIVFGSLLESGLQLSYITYLFSNARHNVKKKGVWKTMDNKTFTVRNLLWRKKLMNCSYSSSPSRTCLMLQFQHHLESSAISSTDCSCTFYF